ncbi:MAG: HNH endonuclease [Candidatus Eisenbacteria bacterium]|uniref:HNH endonuclease n=1 Tax=Eiseniibacteriota bacterium TaxID=2212470 RepID=A0A538TR72_UNCEI|nr:MAG: HNH endonuclease [Candidatus Eisenbacteria bacterium]
MSAVVLLAPYLTEENAEGLLAAATHKTKAEIEVLLAQRFPRPDMFTGIRAIEPPVLAGQLSPGIVEAAAAGSPEAAPAEPPAQRPRVAPLAPRRFSLQLTICQQLHDKLRYAQELLSHQIPPGDIPAVFERALDSLIRQLEKRKIAATQKPRASHGHKRAAGRYVPAEIKRAVWRRDQGRCTFVSEDGRRCQARKFLEFDHIDEVARGGTASVERMRLRCRAHNQYGAERTFGAGFMQQKREQSRRAAACTRGTSQRSHPMAQEPRIPCRRGA